MCLTMLTQAAFWEVQPGCRGTDLKPGDRLTFADNGEVFWTRKGVSLDSWACDCHDTENPDEVAAIHEASGIVVTIRCTVHPGGGWGILSCTQDPPAPPAPGGNDILNRIKQAFVSLIGPQSIPGPGTWTALQSSVGIQ